MWCTTDTYPHLWNSARCSLLPTKCAKNEDNLFIKTYPDISPSRTPSNRFSIQQMRCDLSCVSTNDCWSHEVSIYIQWITDHDSLSKSLIISHVHALSQQLLSCMTTIEWFAWQNSTLPVFLPLVLLSRKRERRKEKEKKNERRRGGRCCFDVRMHGVVHRLHISILGRDPTISKMQDVGYIFSPTLSIVCI